MFRFIKCFLIIFIITAMLSGCGDPNVSQPQQTDQVEQIQYVLPEISEDFLVVLSGNADVAFTDRSCSMNRNYTVYSAMPLTTEDVTVKFDTSFPYSFDIASTTDDPLPFDLFALYNGVQWDALSEYQTGFLTEELGDEYDFIHKLGNVYNGLSEEQLPKLYYSVLMLTFENPKALAGHEPKSMTVCYKEQEYTFPVEGLSYQESSTVLMDYGVLFCDTFALTDMSVEPNAEGSFFVNGINLSAEKDVSIEKIYFLDTPSSVVDDVTVAQVQDDRMTLDYIWDRTKPLELKTGEQLTISVQAHDPLFANTFTATASRIMVIMYSHAEGNSEIFIELTYRMRPNAFLVYAAEVDELDFSGYFSDYLPFTKDNGIIVMG